MLDILNINIYNSVVLQVFNFYSFQMALSVPILMFQADCDLEHISNFHDISTLLDFRLAALAILISRVELVGHLVWMMPQN